MCLEQSMDHPRQAQWLLRPGLHGWWLVGASDGVWAEKETEQIAYVLFSYNEVRRSTGAWKVSTLCVVGLGRLPVFVWHYLQKTFRPLQVLSVLQAALKIYIILLPTECKDPCKANQIDSEIFLRPKIKSSRAFIKQDMFLYNTSAHMCTLHILSNELKKKKNRLRKMRFLLFCWCRIQEVYFTVY